MTLRDFDLLTDENIDPLIVQFLGEVGFDVLDVNEQGWAGLKTATCYRLLINRAALWLRTIAILVHLFSHKVNRSREFCTCVLVILMQNHTGRVYGAILASELQVITPFILIAEHTPTKIKIRIRLL